MVKDMYRFIKRLFGSSPHESETIFTSTVDKFKEKDSNLFRYAKRNKWINKDNQKKEKQLSWITVPVAENVLFGEASSISLSFRDDNITKGSPTHGYVTENKTDCTLSSLCTWELDDGSKISEVVTYPKGKDASARPNVLSLIAQMSLRGSNESLPAGPIKCNHCGTLVEKSLSECPSCNRPVS